MILNPIGGKIMVYKESFFPNYIRVLGFRNVGSQLDIVCAFYQICRMGFRQLGI